MDKEVWGEITVTERKPRKIIAIDETVVKADGEKYYVYAASKEERINPNESLSFEKLFDYQFVKEVLKYCENKPKFIIDKAPWLIDALKSINLEYEHQSFRNEK